MGGSPLGLGLGQVVLVFWYGNARFFVEEGKYGKEENARGKREEARGEVREDVGLE